jgi:hypothetical protein
MRKGYSFFYFAFFTFALALSGCDFIKSEPIKKLDQQKSMPPSAATVPASPVPSPLPSPSATPLPSPTLTPPAPIPTQNPPAPVPTVVPPAPSPTVAPTPPAVPSGPTTLEEMIRLRNERKAAARDRFYANDLYLRIYERDYSNARQDSANSPSVTFNILPDHLKASPSSVVLESYFFDQDDFLGKPSGVTSLLNGGPIKLSDLNVISYYRQKIGISLLMMSDSANPALKSPLSLAVIEIIPEAPPISLCTKNDLEKIRTNLAAHYRLDCDIDMGGQTFTPIGRFSDPHAFTGIFDGNGHVIENFMIDNQGLANGVCPLPGDGSSPASGFFAHLKGGVVKNLSLRNVKARGCYQMGAVAGVVSDRGGIYNVDSSFEVIDTGRTENTTGYLSGIGGLAGGVQDGYILKSKGSLKISPVGGQMMGGLVGGGDRLIVLDAEGKIDFQGRTGSLEDGEKLGGLIGSLSDISYILDTRSSGQILLPPPSNFLTQRWHIGGAVGFLSQGYFENPIVNTKIVAPFGYLVGGFAGIAGGLWLRGGEITADVLSSGDQGALAGTLSGFIQRTNVRGRVEMKNYISPVTSPVNMVKGEYMLGGLTGQALNSYLEDVSIDVNLIGEPTGRLKPETNPLDPDSYENLYVGGVSGRKFYSTDLEIFWKIGSNVKLTYLRDTMKNVTATYTFTFRNPLNVAFDNKLVKGGINGVSASLAVTRPDLYPAPQNIYWNITRSGINVGNGNGISAPFTGLLQSEWIQQSFPSFDFQRIWKWDITTGNPLISQ